MTQKDDGKIMDQTFNDVNGCSIARAREWTNSTEMTRQDSCKSNPT